MFLTPFPHLFIQIELYPVLQLHLSAHLYAQNNLQLCVFEVLSAKVLKLGQNYRLTSVVNLEVEAL